MHFASEVNTNELRCILSRFLSIIGYIKLKPRLEQIEKQARNSEWMRYSKERLGLETALIEVLSYQKSTNRILWPPRNPSQYRLYSFISTVVKVYNRLPSPAKVRLTGELNKCINQEDGFGPLAFEMNMATHLMSAGFDVTFSDLEGQAQFDLLACKDNCVVEVECKFVSADIGRKIHQRKFLQLAEHLRPSLENIIEKSDGGTFIKVELVDRLSASTEEFELIRNSLEEVLRGQETNSLRLSVTKNRFNFSESPIVSGTRNPRMLLDLQEYVAKYFNVNNSHIMLRADMSRATALLLSVSSKKPDRVLNSIYEKHLRESSRQLTGTRTGIACLYFADLSEDQLHEVAGTESHLINVVNHILRRRPKMYGVVLMTSGTVRQKDSRLLYVPTVTNETGPAYSFRNPFASPDEAASDVFNKIFGTHN
ncbi:MAG: hypothetical protein WBK91_06065 [Alphaproteobacteria bacterium]